MDPFSLILTIILLGVIVWQWRQSIRLGRELAKGLMALEHGRPVWPIQERPWSVFGHLAKLFNRIAPRLEVKVGELESDRQQLRAVLESMTEGVIVVDQNRRLRFANRSAEVLFVLGGGAVGRLTAEVIRSPSIRNAIDATLASDGPYRGEAVLAAHYEPSRINPKIFAVHGMPTQGPPREAVLVFHDITELRRLERMRQDFVANVSHELKTPLASIRAYAETLLDWALEDPELSRKYLTQIDEQSERLEFLIQDLLRLARIESGQDIFDHQPMKFAPFLRDRVASFQDKAQTKNITLTLECRIKDSDEIRADEEAIRQIVDNLIDNAIKYTNQTGWVKVIAQYLKAKNAVTLRVVDNGIGIALDEQPRIFERFYRVDKARSREMGGTGLGLSIVKHLVQAIGANIELQSRVGSGSQFTVTIPQTIRTNKEEEVPHE